MEFTFRAPQAERRDAIQDEIDRLKNHPPPGNPSAPVLRGRVLTEYGESIAGATVVLLPAGAEPCPLEVLARDGRIAVTEPGGGYQLRSTLLESPRPEGIEVHVRREGFLPFWTPVPQGFAHTEFDVVLRQGLSIRGQVLAPQGEEGIPDLRVTARCLGMPADAACIELFVPGSAEFQASVTGAGGRFELGGLTPGHYMVEVTEAGLAGLPHVGDLRASGPGMARGVVARAGQDGVRLRVVPLAAACVAVKDQVSGAAVGCARVTPRLKQGARWAHTSESAALLRANGRTWDLRPDVLPQSMFAIIAISESWPVPGDASVPCRVEAPGYEEAAAEIPLVPIGSSEFLAPVDVALRPVEEQGAATLCLRTATGEGIGPVAMWLRLAHSSRNDALWLRAHFDSGGNSCAVSVPVGNYSVSADPRNPAMVLENASLNVIRGAPAEATLRLTSAAFRVTAVDEDGNALDDVGVLAGPGRGPVSASFRYDRERRVLAFDGQFIVAPGLGRSRALPFFAHCPGDWTIELYRHGCRPQREFVTLSEGRITDVTVEMTADREGTWDTWSREWSNQPEDVLPPRRRARTASD